MTALDQKSHSFWTSKWPRSRTRLRSEVCAASDDEDENEREDEDDWSAAILKRTQSHSLSRHTTSWSSSRKFGSADWTRFQLGISGAPKGSSWKALAAARIPRTKVATACSS